MRYRVLGMVLGFRALGFRESHDVMEAALQELEKHGYFTTPAADSSAEAPQRSE